MTGHVQGKIRGAKSLISLPLLLQLVWMLLRYIKQDKKLPPGPRGFPVFGSLHLLGKFPHRDLHKLAQKYGPIMFIRLGLTPTVVISSPEYAEQFLKTHDLVFASKAPNEAAKHIGYNQQTITFSPYGSYWRNLRKMCTLELLSNLKVNSFKSMRRQELHLLIDHIKESARRGRVVVDLSAKVSSLSANMSSRMVFGKKYMEEEFDERGFKAVVHEALVLAASFNLSDYIPPIAPLDLQGLGKKMKAVSKVFDAFLEKIIDEHIQSLDQNRTKDFVDVLLTFLGSHETEYSIDRENIKAIILDMLVASMDTSATAIEWVLAELMKHPRVMKKVQKELQEKIGMGRMVEELDLDSLDYLNMVIKETFRLHPAVPLLHHESTQDSIINGFSFPKKTHMFINVWAIGRDPNAWTDAEEFLPERFTGSSIDVRGHDFQLLPFGSGRRGCPAMQLGLTVVGLVVAQLVHSFDWELPNNMLPGELDMDEDFSLIMPRANHLLAVPTYKLLV